MISTALFRKTFRDYLVVWLAAMGLGAAFAVFFMIATGEIPQSAGQVIAQVPWVRDIFRGLLGADLLDSWTPTGIASFLHTHPFVWAVVIAFSMTLSSAALAGEVDRGTFDLLGALPISRTGVYVTQSAAILAMSVCLCGAILGGQAFGRFVEGLTFVRMDQMARVSAHFIAAVIFLIGFCMMISSACSRRGTALGIAFLFVFYWFVLNFLSELWPPAKHIAFTSFLHYYKPLLIVRDAAWHWRDISVLVGCGVVCWLIGWAVWVKRDVPAR